MLQMLSFQDHLILVLKSLYQGSQVLLIRPIGHEDQFLLVGEVVVLMELTCIILWHFRVKRFFMFKTALGGPSLFLMKCACTLIPFKSQP